MPTPSPSPLTIKAYSFFVSAAERRDVIAALSVWTLARAVDSAGSGKVRLDDIKSAASGIWSDSKTRRCLHYAVKLGLFSVAKGDVYMAGLTKAALLVGAETPTVTAIEIETQALKTVHTFRAAIWAAFQTEINGRVISRARLEACSGVRERTQRRREARANASLGGKIIKNRNAHDTGVEATSASLAMWRECEHPGCYSIGGRVVRPLPNTYRSTHRRAGITAAKKAARRIRSENREIGERLPKTFFPDEESARSYVRAQQKRLAKGKQPGAAETTIAYFAVGRTGNTVIHRALR